MKERPKRDRRLRSSAHPGNSFHLLDGKRPETMEGSRIVLRRMETHHHLVEVMMVLCELHISRCHLANCSNWFAAVGGLPECQFQSAGCFVCQCSLKWTPFFGQKK